LLSDPEYSLPASPIDSGAPAITPDYKDRSTGLVIFGILEIGGGAMAALAIPIALFGAMVSRKATGGGMPMGSLFVTVLAYALASAVLVTLGIGATQAKRWARALNLIVSWVWLIGGSLVTVLIVFIFPSAVGAGLQAAAKQDPNAQVSTAAMAVILTLMIMFLAIFFVAVPLAFLLFYRSGNVEETCKRRDPVERWTDRLPLPILAFGLMASFEAVYYFLQGVAAPLFPFFGRYLTGLPGALAFVVIAALDVYIAVSFFRMKVAGWWVAVLTVLVRLSSAAITFARGNLFQAYSRMGWSQAEIDRLQRNPLFRGGVFLWWSLGFMVVYLGFLLWTKRYFPVDAKTGYTDTHSSLTNRIEPAS